MAAAALRLHPRMCQPVSYTRVMSGAIAGKSALLSPVGPSFQAAIRGSRATVRSIGSPYLRFLRSGHAGRDSVFIVR